MSRPSDSCRFARPFTSAPAGRVRHSASACARTSLEGEKSGRHCSRHHSCSSDGVRVRPPAPATAPGPRPGGDPARPGIAPGTRHQLRRRPGRRRRWCAQSASLRTREPASSTRMPDHAPAVDAQGSTELIEVVDGLREGNGTVRHVDRPQPPARTVRPCDRPRAGLPGQPGSPRARGRRGRARQATPCQRSPSRAAPRPPGRRHLAARSALPHRDRRSTRGLEPAAHALLPARSVRPGLPAGPRHVAVSGRDHRCRVRRRTAARRPTCRCAHHLCRSGQPHPGRWHDEPARSRLHRLAVPAPRARTSPHRPSPCAAGACPHRSDHT